MVEEKMLIKKEKFNLVQRIKNFINKLFNKKEVAEIEPKSVEKNTILEELRNPQDILKLQKEYENGNVKEDNLNDVEKEELKKLYQKQIKSLEDEIIIYKKNLQYYKNEIITLRNNIAK